MLGGRSRRQDLTPLRYLLASHILARPCLAASRGYRVDHTTFSEAICSQAWDSWCYIHDMDTILLDDNTFFVFEHDKRSSNTRLTACLHSSLI